MIAKWLICLIFASTSLVARAEDFAKIVATKGIPGRVSVRVNGDDGLPIPNAKILFAFSVEDERDPLLVEALTDSNGVAVGEKRVSTEVAIHVNKDGYYENFIRYWFPRADKSSYDTGRWEPWNQTIDTVLYKRQNPNGQRLRILSADGLITGKTYGFSLRRKAIVDVDSPGNDADFFFASEGDFSTEEINMAAIPTQRLRVWFTDSSDGLIRSRKNHDSAFRFAYDAPLSGYVSEYQFETIRANNKTKSSFVSHGEDYLVFRMSAKDADDQLDVETYYGIIEKLTVGRSEKSGQYFFSIMYRINSTPGDRNIEYQ